MCSSYRKAAAEQVPQGEHLAISHWQLALCFSARCVLATAKQQRSRSLDAVIRFSQARLGQRQIFGPRDSEIGSVPDVAGGPAAFLMEINMTKQQIAAAVLECADKL